MKTLKCNNSIFNDAFTTARISEWIETQCSKYGFCGKYIGLTHDIETMENGELNWTIPGTCIELTFTIFGSYECKN